MDRTVLQAFVFARKSSTLHGCCTHKNNYVRNFSKFTIYALSEALTHYTAPARRISQYTPISSTAAPSGTPAASSGFICAVTTGALAAAALASAAGRFTVTFVAAA